MCYVTAAVSVAALQNGQCHVKTSFRAYVDSDGPDQSVYPHNLIRAFAVC